MVLATTTLTDTVDNVAVKGVSEGIAYILVKDSKGNLVTTLPISIVAKRVPTTLELDKTSVELSVATAAAVTADVKVTVKDQYGNKYGDVTPTLELVSKPSNARTALPATAANKITFVGHDYLGKEGSYTYKVTYKDRDKTAENYLYFNAVINSATAGVTYDIVLSNTTPDMKVNESDTVTTLQSGCAVKVMIGKFQGGVLVDYQTVASVSSISVKHADGSTIDVTSGSAAATEAAVTLAIDSGSAVRKDGKVGVYTVGL